MIIEEKYLQLCQTESDINEHLPTIRKYARISENVVELGVRGMVSTWAMLAGYPRWMRSIDIVHPSEHGGNVSEAKRMAKEERIDWDFIKASSLEVELPRHDLLFIDTIHSYEQLSQELKIHPHNTVKYIIMHDSTLSPMARAINEFLAGNNDWRVKEHFENNNSLTVLQRV